MKKSKLFPLFLLISLLILLFFTGCDSEITKRYTPKNMLIGAALGVGVMLFLSVIGSVFGKGKKDDKKDDNKE